MRPVGPQSLPFLDMLISYLLIGPGDRSGHMIFEHSAPQPCVTHMHKRQEQSDWPLLPTLSYCVLRRSQGILYILTMPCWGHLRT